MAAERSSWQVAGKAAQASEQDAVVKVVHYDGATGAPAPEGGRKRAKRRQAARLATAQKEREAQTTNIALKLALALAQRPELKPKAFGGRKLPHEKTSRGGKPSQQRRDARRKEVHKEVSKMPLPSIAQYLPPSVLATPSGPTTRPSKASPSEVRRHRRRALTSEIDKFQGALDDAVAWNGSPQDNADRAILEKEIGEMKAELKKLAPHTPAKELVAAVKSRLAGEQMQGNAKAPRAVSSGCSSSSMKLGSVAAAGTALIANMQPSPTRVVSGGVGGETVLRKARGRRGRGSKNDSTPKAVVIVGAENALPTFEYNFERDESLPSPALRNADRTCPSVCSNDDEDVTILQRFVKFGQTFTPEDVVAYPVLHQPPPYRGRVLAAPRGPHVLGRATEVYANQGVAARGVARRMKPLPPLPAAAPLPVAAPPPAPPPPPPSVVRIRPLDSALVRAIASLKPTPPPAPPLAVLAGLPAPPIWHPPMAAPIASTLQSIREGRSRLRRAVLDVQGPLTRDGARLAAGLVWRYVLRPGAFGTPPVRVCEWEVAGRRPGDGRLKPQDGWALELRRCLALPVETAEEVVSEETDCPKRGNIGEKKPMFANVSGSKHRGARMGPSAPGDLTAHLRRFALYRRRDAQLRIQLVQRANTWVSDHDMKHLSEEQITDAVALAVQAAMLPSAGEELARDALCSDRASARIERTNEEARGVHGRTWSWKYGFIPWRRTHEFPANA
jgi:hypothetical protein